MEKEFVTNEIKTVTTGENTISIGDADFEFVSAETFEKGMPVTAVIDFNKIELTDDENEANLGGNITSIIYKGTYCEAKVWLDNDTSLIVHTPYEWDDNDRVGIVIKKDDIKVASREDKKD
jgi:hypothetical protein